MINRQPIIYSLVGLFASGAIIAWILLTAKPTGPSAPSNFPNSVQLSRLYS